MEKIFTNTYILRWHVFMKNIKWISLKLHFRSIYTLIITKVVVFIRVRYDNEFEIKDEF